MLLEMFDPVCCQAGIGNTGVLRGDEEATQAPSRAVTDRGWAEMDHRRGPPIVYPSYPWLPGSPPQ